VSQTLEYPIPQQSTFPVRCIKPTYSAHVSDQFILFVCLFLALQPASGSGPPHSRGFQITHKDASQSIELLWTSDQLVAETSTWQHTTLTTDKHPCLLGGIRTYSVSKRAAADPRLRQRGHWDRQLILHTLSNEITLYILSKRKERMCCAVLQRHHTEAVNGLCTHEKDLFYKFSDQRVAEPHGIQVKKP